MRITSVCCSSGKLESGTRASSHPLVTSANLSLHPSSHTLPLDAPTHTSFSLSHTHISTNALLTRSLSSYYNREAVVISALQVEKHPVTMPGPFVTPPAQRHLFHSNSAFYMTPPARRPDLGASRVTVTSRTASPLPGGRFGSLMSLQSGPPGATAPPAPPGTHHPLLHGSPQWRSSPKPHSSPKMKLRCVRLSDQIGAKIYR